MPSVTLGKGFAECISAFAECLKHSAKKVNPIVRAQQPPRPPPTGRVVASPDALPEAARRRLIYTW